MQPLVNPTIYEMLDFEEKVSINVWIAREKAGLTRTDLAKMLNITPDVMRNIETMWHDKTRRQSIGLGELQAIAVALNCPLMRLMPKDENS
jgi:ribosome-binding protein aMBF1 (putative translation factor)